MDSGYLDVLPHKTTVLAEREFKQISPMLEAKGCILVRPPSVGADEILSKKDVKLGKVIASIRIHVERIIQRIRLFEMLKPHAYVHHSLLKYMDHIVIIACALVNVQKPIL